MLWKYFVFSFVIKSINDTGETNPSSPGIESFSFSYITLFFSSLVFRWERRVDSHNRVYYVDHTTRTTTWHPPSANLLDNVTRWRQWYELRSGNMQNHMSELYATSGWMAQQAAAHNPGGTPEALGPLPEGFGK